MRMYKVFKCEDYTFEWAGGCTIKVHWDALDSNGDTLVDVIEFYETFTDKEVAGLCLDWLEESGVIDEAEAYLL